GRLPRRPPIPRRPAGGCRARRRRAGRPPPSAPARPRQQPTRPHPTGPSGRPTTAERDDRRRGRTVLTRLSRLSPPIGRGDPPVTNPAVTTEGCSNRWSEPDARPAERPPCLAARVVLGGGDGVGGAQQPPDRPERRHHDHGEHRPGEGHEAEHDRDHDPFRHRRLTGTGTRVFPCVVPAHGFGELLVVVSGPLHAAHLPGRGYPQPPTSHAAASHPATGGVTQKCYLLVTPSLPGRRDDRRARRPPPAATARSARPPPRSGASRARRPRGPSTRARPAPRRRRSAHPAPAPRRRRRSPGPGCARARARAGPGR